MIDSAMTTKKSELRRIRAAIWRVIGTTNPWAIELLVLAASYGVLMAACAVSDLQHDGTQGGFFQYAYALIPICFVVMCAAFMNFIFSGYLFTSLIARVVCMRTAPKIYPVVLSCLVVAHIELLKYLDGQWALTINEKLFVGWGASVAFVSAVISVKRERGSLGSARNDKFLLREIV